MAEKKVSSILHACDNTDCTRDPVPLSSLRVCSACHNARYCSDECRTADSHSEACARIAAEWADAKKNPTHRINVRIAGRITSLLNDARCGLNWQTIHHMLARDLGFLLVYKSATTTPDDEHLCKALHHAWNYLQYTMTTTKEEEEADAHAPIPHPEVGAYWIALPGDADMAERMKACAKPKRCYLALSVEVVTDPPTPPTNIESILDME